MHVSLPNPAQCIALPVIFEGLPRYTLLYSLCCCRDYTNPLLPVAPSAIDASGQVRV